MFSFFTPAFRQISTLSPSSRTTCSISCPSSTPPLCIIKIGISCLAATSAILLPLAPFTSFSTSTPTSIMYSATLGLYVSTLKHTSGNVFLNVGNTLCNLASSSFSLTTVEPGPVDSAPISIISAPSATILRTPSIAASTS